MRKWQWLLIILVFVGIRIPTWRSYDPDLDFVVQQVRAFDRYGILERRGVLIWNFQTHGRVPNPSDYNYPNHSPVLYWVAWALTHLSGERSLWFIGLTIGWVNLVLAWRVACHARFSAAQTTCLLLLLSASPTSARWEVEVVAVFVATQLLGFWAILRQSEPTQPDSKLNLMVYLLAVAAALAADWLCGFTVAGWLCYLWLERKNPKLHGWWIWTLVALVGAVAAYATYVTGVSPPGEHVSGYVLTQAGLSSGYVPRSRLALTIALKFFLLIGPLTALVGLLALIGVGLGRLGNRTQLPFIRLAVLQVAAWCGFHVIFSQLCAIEQWTYVFFVFSLAGLACIPLGNVLENRTYSRLRRGTVIAALAGTVTFQFAFVWLRGAIQQDTKATLAVASFLREQTQPEDMILSRLSHTSTPLAVDQPLLGAKADRLMFFPNRYTHWWTDRIGPHANRYVLVQDNSPDPLPEAIAAAPMESVATTTVPLAPRKLNLAMRLQLFYWRLRSAPPQFPEVEQEAGSVTVRLLRVKASETSAFPLRGADGGSK